MKKEDHTGWHVLTDSMARHGSSGAYPLAAYSEFMPAPHLGCGPLDKVNRSLLPEGDPYGWNISELEQELELRPGLAHIGKQIMRHLVNLGTAAPEFHLPGHGGNNLRDNPYWPAELARSAGRLHHERYVVLLPMMLSRTQDDKGRVKWTLFGSSVHGPEAAFWKSFYSAPGKEIPPNDATAFCTHLLSSAYGESVKHASDLLACGFRILPTDAAAPLPAWTKPLVVDDNAAFDSVRYLLTFRPFGALPSSVRDAYLAGRMVLLPFPGSLVFWGMPTFVKLARELPEAGQIPLQRLVSRNQGIGSLRVPQSGWIHEPRPGHGYTVSHELVLDTFHRTSRWDRVHRFQDELNQEPRLCKVARALFSTELSAIGLYDKPLARNCQLWGHDFRLLLDGPRGTRAEILRAEAAILEGGLFGYRFFYPPMQIGSYSVYWHYPLVAYCSKGSDEAQILDLALSGYLTAYHNNDKPFSRPVDLWPRLLDRPQYVSAAREFHSPHDLHAHQTSLNIAALLDSWEENGKKPLRRSFARQVLNIAKHTTIEEWLDDLPPHAVNPESGVRMSKSLSGIIAPPSTEPLPAALTYEQTATRDFEVALWGDIRFLAHGDFVNKDNADRVTDAATVQAGRGGGRDLEPLGDYLVKRHRQAIAQAGMDGRALVGEHRFAWQTEFEYRFFGGWKGNQEGRLHERNILVVIPGKNRSQAVVLADHYDTAYMEDVYETQRGGSGARLSARGADDNCSATATILQAAPIFLDLARQGKLERDIWLLHLTGEEFPSDCLGARAFCRALIEKSLKLYLDAKEPVDLSTVSVAGLCVMDMIAHNRESDPDIFQISPGASDASLRVAYEAHVANVLWNEGAHEWNKRPDRRQCVRGKRCASEHVIPEQALFLPLHGEVRTHHNPHSSLFNTDGQMFSDCGVPAVLFMENYDINRSGYHDTKDTMANIDLDYGAAAAAIAIETIARLASIGE